MKVKTDLSLNFRIQGHFVNHSLNISPLVLFILLEWEYVLVLTSQLAWRLLLAATLFIYLIFLFTLGHLHGSSWTWEFGTNQRVGNRLELWYDILLFGLYYAYLFFNRNSYGICYDFVLSPDRYWDFCSSSICNDWSKIPL